MLHIPNMFGIFPVSPQKNHLKMFLSSQNVVFFGEEAQYKQKH